MKRVISLLLAALILSAGGFGAVAQENATESSSPGDLTINESESTEESLNLPPGIYLAMVLSQIRMEIKGNATAVMLKYRLMHNANESEVAEIVMNKTEELRNLIQEKLQQKEQLIQRYQNGEINETEFAFEMLRINMEFRNAVKELMALEECYGNFSMKVKMKLMERGINATAIEMLKMKAREMSGGDVGEIAKTIREMRVAKVKVENKEKVRGAEEESENEEVERTAGAGSEVKEKVKEAVEEKVNEKKGGVNEKRGRGRSS